MDFFIGQYIVENKPNPHYGIITGFGKNGIGEDIVSIAWFRETVSGVGKKSPDEFVYPKDIKKAWLSNENPAMPKDKKPSFDEIINEFRINKLDVNKFNFCIESESYNTYSAYIMGDGAEQCLAFKDRFKNKQEIIDLYKSLGVSKIIDGVG